MLPIFQKIFFLVTIYLKQQSLGKLQHYVDQDN